MDPNKRPKTYNYVIRHLIMRKETFGCSKLLLEERGIVNYSRNMSIILKSLGNELDMYQTNVVFSHSTE